MSSKLVLISIPIQLAICLIFLQIQRGFSFDISSILGMQPSRVFLEQENIIKVHQIVREGLQKLLVEEDQKDNEILQSKLKFEELDKKTAEETFNNPISAFKYYNSAGDDLFYLLGYIENRNLSQEFLKEMDKLKDISEFFPDGIKNTVSSAALAIARIQSLYNLDIFDMKKGDLLGFKTNDSFSAWDLMYIGKECQIVKALDYVIDWISKSQLLCEEENSCESYRIEMNNSLKISNLEVLVTFHHELRQKDLVKKYLEEIIELNPSHEDAINIKKTLYNFPKEEPTASKNSMNAKFRQLCQGKSEFTKIPTLNCSYSDFGLNYYKIGPQKIEVVHKNPYLVIFHDLMNEKEISILKKYSQRKVEPLKKSKAEGDGDGNKKNELNEKLLTTKKIFEKLSRLVGFGLEEEEEEEPFKIFEYVSYDGIFNNRVHFENEDSIRENSGQFVFFFNDIEEFHGATIYENLGISIRPRKGSVIYFLNPPKKSDDDKIHRARECPLIHHSKFVAYKWFN